jgi:hypothetical protein
MEVSEVIRRSENNISLFSATMNDLISARKLATRSIQIIEIDSEIHKRNKKPKTTVVSGITHVRRDNRCPTKKDLR